jgi:RND family efflux transporter MFP subunit
MKLPRTFAIRRDGRAVSRRSDRSRAKRLPCLVAVATATAAGCLGSGQTDGPPPAKPPDVVVVPPVVRSVTEYEEFSGRTEATSQVDVRCRVSGYLNKANFKEGSDVSEGDLLFEIDARTYKAELDKAIADVAQTKARISRLQGVLKRGTELYQRKVITQEEAERAVYEHQEAVAALEAAKAAQELAALNVGFTRVTAPLSGRISRRYVDPGNLVKADDTLLTTIVSLDPLYAYFDIDERTLLRLRRLAAEGKIKGAESSSGVGVDIGLADEQGYSLSGPSISSTTRSIPAPEPCGLVP